MAWTGNKKAFCVLDFAKTETIVTVQRRFRTIYHTEPPTEKNNSWVVHEILAEWLLVRCETNRLAVCGRNLITGLTSDASPRMDKSSTCKVGQKLGVSLPLLTCYPSAWPSRLLYPRVRKSRRGLWITLYSYVLILKWWGDSYAISYLYFI